MRASHFELIRTNFLDLETQVRGILDLIKNGLAEIRVFAGIIQK